MNLEFAIKRDLMAFYVALVHVNKIKRRKPTLVLFNIKIKKINVNLID